MSEISLESASIQISPIPSVMSILYHGAVKKKALAVRGCDLGILSVRAIAAQ
jgi:hypothetical protein